MAASAVLAVQVRRDYELTVPSPIERLRSVHVAVEQWLTTADQLEQNYSNQDGSENECRDKLLHHVTVNMTLQLSESSEVVQACADEFLMCGFIVSSVSSKTPRSRTTSV